MIKTFGKYNVMLKEEEHTANYIFREMKVWRDANVRILAFSTITICPSTLMRLARLYEVMYVSM